MTVLIVIFLLFTFFFALVVQTYKWQTVLGFHIISLLEAADDYVPGEELIRALRESGIKVRYENFSFACLSLERARCVLSLDKKARRGQGAGALDAFGRRSFKIRPGAQLRWKFSRVL